MQAAFFALSPAAGVVAAPGAAQAVAMLPKSMYGKNRCNELLHDLSSIKM
jgi:hypothetical protein